MRQGFRFSWQQGFPAAVVPTEQAAIKIAATRKIDFITDRKIAIELSLPHIVTQIGSGELYICMHINSGCFHVFLYERHTFTTRARC